MRDPDEIDPMGWRLRDSVVRGEIDGRDRQRVTGRIWLIDREFPIKLNLRGTPLRDIAGCVLTFENPNPAVEDNEGLCPVQMGRTGIITASRKLRVYELPEENVQALERRGEPVVSHLANALYIEWYSNANGRVVIESTGFTIRVSDFSWRMTPAEEAEQLAQNRNAQQRWAEIINEEENGDEDDEDDALDWHMDEFEWEKQLRESDAITERYMELMETYLDHPEREKIIAHEMGWNWLEDDEEEDDSSYAGFPEWDIDLDAFDDGEDLPPLEPNPLTEGRDWIRAKDGRIRHPLTQRATSAAISMWRFCKDQSMVGEGGDPDLHNMLFHAQTFGAKLAGALDSLAYDEDPDGGFVVACLKRALKFFELSIRSASLVSQKHILPAPELQAFRDELFAIRQETLTLMQYYRQLH